MTLRYGKWMGAFAVSSCFVFLAGLGGLWVSNQMNQRLVARVLILQKSIRSSTCSEEEIDRLRKRSDDLDSWSEYMKSNDPFFLESGKHLDAITLSGQVHKLVNELRNCYANSGVLVKDRNFGFSQYIEDIGFSSEMDQTHFLAHELYLVDVLSRILLESNPISLDSLVLENVSFDRDDQVGNRLSCRIAWCGYTDSFRSFLNRIQEDRIPVRYVSIRVERSEISEVDLVETFLSDDALLHGKERRQHAPFSGFLELEDQEGSEFETMPLIGETISRFTVIAELVSS